jgi:PAS domain S-box-containing protein
MLTQGAQQLPEADALRSFIAGAPDAMLLFALDAGDAWLIIDCNAAACRLFGYTRDELVGHGAALFDRPQDEPIVDMLRRARQAGALCIQASHHRLDGTRVDVELALTPLSHAGISLIVAVVRDITAHRRTARRLSAEHAISRLLASAGHFMDIAEQMLRIIGEELEWDVVHTGRQRRAGLHRHLAGRGGPCCRVRSREP